MDGWLDGSSRWVGGFHLILHLGFDRKLNVDKQLSEDKQGY